MLRKDLSRPMNASSIAYLIHTTHVLGFSSGKAAERQNGRTAEQASYDITSTSKRVGISEPALPELDSHKYVTAYA